MMKHREDKALDLLMQLISHINREDGYYVLPGVSRETGNESTFEVTGGLEEVLDDVVQLLCDENLLQE